MVIGGSDAMQLNNNLLKIKKSGVSKALFLSGVAFDHSVPRNQYLGIGSTVRSGHLAPIGVNLPLTRQVFGCNCCIRK